MKQLYQLCFYLVTGLTFLYGGFLQYTFGFSNTLLTFFIVGILLLTYVAYAILKNKVVFNKTILWFIIYALLIVFTGILRSSHPILIGTYTIFAILPVSVYLFGFINYKEAYLSFSKIFRLFYYISLIQFPVLLIQKSFYGVLIRLNNSGQIIEWFDFMFGTFFIKSDHSLGVFIILIITVILYQRERVSHIVKYPWPAVVYLTATLFLTQSNISKLIIVIILTSYIIVPLYKKYRKGVVFKSTVVVLGALILTLGYLVKDKQFIQDRLGGSFQRQFSLESSERFYELGTAKRFQVIIVAANKLKTKWLGDGPYSYFDIRTGKFKQTRHFSQLLWTYFDLGILGLLVLLGFTISILKFLQVDYGVAFYFLLGIFLIYAFYTTVYSDVAIMLGLFSLYQRRNSIQNEHEPKV